MKKSIIISPQDMDGCDWIARAAQAKLNTLAFHTGGPNHDVAAALQPVLGDAFRAQCRQAGLICEFEEHVAGTFLTPELFEEHPDYLACDEKGVRNHGERVNWCISSGGMRDLITERAGKLAELLRPASHRYYFWSADSAEGLCRCTNCAKYSRPDLNMLTVNAMAEGIRTADPLAEVAYLAYSASSYDTPEKVAPHEAVFLEFAPYIRSFDCTIDDERCEDNRSFCEAVRKLVRYFDPARAHVLEYWLDVSLHNKYQPLHCPVPTTKEIMKHDLEFYGSLGFRHFATFACDMNKTYFDRYGDEPLQWYGEILNELFEEQEKYV